MTGEFACHWIYVSGDVDIDRLADDNNAIRAINGSGRPPSHGRRPSPDAKRGGS